MLNYFVSLIFRNKNAYRLSTSNIGSILDLTPSPSDSGVSELEAALRDRDSELAYLRQTMEHNEQVIFRVYQEKEKVREVNFNDRPKGRFRFRLVSAKKSSFGNSFSFGQKLRRNSVFMYITRCVARRSGEFVTRVLVASSVHWPALLC